MRFLNSWTRLLSLLLVGLAVPGPAMDPAGRGPAGQPFLAADGQLRAEFWGLSARFDAGGAHLLGARGAAPISLRTGGVGRGAITRVPATAPALGGRGLEYSSAGVTEWWGAGPGGFEQGWVVPERPRGTGPLRIRVEVDNATIAVEHGDLTLRGARRHTLAVGGLHAVDAAGEPVAVRFEAAPDGFDVVVEDDRSAYPVEVDPVYTSPDWTVEGTPGFGAADLGRVVPAGDTNGDGYDDVIVQDDDGVAYIFQGGASGMEPVAASILACVGPVDGAGDVDGDGYDDVVVASAAGEVSVYSGGPSGLSDARTSVVMDPEGQSFSLNEALSGAGDVNGDGFDDLVVAAPRDDEEGRLYLFLGSALGVSGSPTTTLQGDYGGEFGTVVSDAGDVNGDGFGDVIVASPDYESSFVRVYLGSAAGLDRTPGYENDGSIYDVGTSLSSAMDVNGDGYDDVLIGTGKCWAHCWEAYYGRVDVVPGSAVGPEDQGWSISGDSPETAVGYEVSGAGDVDGDGFDDVMVGATVYRGGPTGVDFASPLPLAIASSFAAAAGVGDANGDGFTDVLGTTSGAAALYLGSGAADFSAALEFGATGDYLGAALASAGDVNGDGYEDVIVGTDPHRGDGSRALVYLGSAFGIASAANVELSGSAGDHFGFAVAGAGDVNGDGYDDVVIGAYGSGDGGAVYVYLGSDAGIDPATASFELALAGPPTCVAPVGDLNGDGFADFAIGLANDDNGPGEVQVFEGSAMGPPNSASVTLVGEAVRRGMSTGTATRTWWSARTGATWRAPTTHGGRLTPGASTSTAAARAELAPAPPRASAGAPIRTSSGVG